MVLILMQHFRLAKLIIFSKFAVVVGCSYAYKKIKFL